MLIIEITAEEEEELYIIITFMMISAVNSPMQIISHEYENFHIKIYQAYKFVMEQVGENWK